jgi:hypothetical protein
LFTGVIVKVVSSVLAKILKSPYAKRCDGKRFVFVF